MTTRTPCCPARNSKLKEIVILIIFRSPGKTDTLARHGKHARQSPPTMASCLLGYPDNTEFVCSGTGTCVERAGAPANATVGVCECPYLFNVDLNCSKSFYYTNSEAGLAISLVLHDIRRLLTSLAYFLGNPASWERKGNKCLYELE